MTAQTGMAELVVDARCSVGESPVWDAARACLWWLDIPGRQLWCWQAATGQTRTWATPQQVACMALAQGSDALPWGQWVCGTETGVACITPQADGTLAFEALARVAHAQPGMRFNDGRCDRQGRLRAGTMVADMSLASPAGAVYAFEQGPTEGRVRPLLTGLVTPNGMAFSPDGRTMYLSDSHPTVQAVWAFDYDLATGHPHNRRLFIDFKPLPGRPDGAAVDADGCYWVCGNDAGLVHRFTPGGKLDRSLPVPVAKPAMCAFGGSQLDTLFVTSIRPAGDVSAQPLAGGLFALQPGVKGLLETPFA